MPSSIIFTPLHISDSSSSCATFLCHVVLQRLPESTVSLKRRVGRRQELHFEMVMCGSLIPITLHCIQSFKERQKGSDALWYPSPQLDATMC